MTGRSPSGSGFRPAGRAAEGVSPVPASIPNAVSCPNCGEDLSLTVEAELPAQTDLTLTLDVEPGQLMRLDTMAGVMSSFRDLQIAVGESLGCETDVFLAGLSVEENRFSFTARICNSPAQGIEAQRAETVEQGSVHESPVGATGADAPNTSQSSGMPKGGEL